MKFLSRLAHYSFQGITILSLLLCLAMIVFWSRGVGVLRRYEWKQWTVVGNQERSTEMAFTIGNGGLAVNPAFLRRTIGDPQELARVRRDCGMDPALPQQSTPKCGPIGLASRWTSALYPAGSSRAPSFWQKRGFFGRVQRYSGFWGWSWQGMFAVPLWVLVSAFALAPATWAFLRIRRQRRMVQVGHVGAGNEHDRAESRSLNLGCRVAC
jgi:hypothetical protein